ncbi:MAG: GTP-binding protein YcjX, partial [Methylococcales bacterium]|nr:GTP-binding protein YcjX [Methylococcales bacterium]
GQPISCIKGVPKGDTKEVALFPGEVPTEIPTQDDWLEERFNFIEFRPPSLHDIKSKGVPHIRMDRALQFLLGDKV